MVDRVQVVGLKELRNELKALEGNFPKELQQANKRAVAEVIIPAAIANASGQSPRWGGRAIGTIRALATATSAAAAIGTSGVPYVLGKEFGSIKYRQFPPWRGSGPGSGYAFYPAIRSTREQFVEVYGQMLDDLTRRAFPQ
jgi:hypothetical protein